MRSFFIHLLVLGTVLGLSACATKPPAENYLDAGARQHIKSVDAYLIAKQDQIGADIKQNPTLSEISALASGFTLIPVLLDVGVKGVRAVNANKMAKPIREKLEGHDYASEFRKQVRQSLAGGTLDGIEDFTLLRSEYPGLRGELITESDADAVLLMDMKYAFTPNFETLYVHSFAMLFPNKPELKRFQETPDRDKLVEFSDNIYRNQFGVGISTKLEEAEAAEHAAVWAQMTEEQLVEVLDVAALALADGIANDISIDDLESDLDLIPEGYALNTKYENFNQQYARLKSLDSVLDTPSEEQETQTDPEAEIEAAEVDVKTGS